MECRECNLCERPGRVETAPEIGKIRSNVRRFRDREFTVWRCGNCGSLHCLEDIDYAHYYQDYPLFQQKPDFFTLQLFSARLKQLVGGGLTRQHGILDFGCGNGGFVRYLRDQGYRAEGYDPYAVAFQDAGLLQNRYDFVVCQDVLEHAQDTLAFLDQILSLACRNGGMAVIGTPDAGGIRLDDSIDAVGQLHQPYHRHILERRRLEGLIAARGFRVVKTLTRWYVDTWIPFLNSSFFFAYVEASGGALDSIFEPIRFPLVLGSPRLLYRGLFGRLHDPGKDMLVFAQTQDAGYEPRTRKP